MIPLRDDIPARRFPLITVSLIVINVIVFFYELRLGPHLNNFLLNWAIIPIRYTDTEIARHFTIPEQILPFFSSMFLHGGWLHLVGNLWILWIFGDNVEDRLGRLKFLGLYLAGGMAAGTVHVFTNFDSRVPTIGASGAIAAVMGSYFRFFPFARVRTLIPPFFLGPFLEVPAILFLGWWFLLQLFNGSVSVLRANDFADVAWWAHIGGFVFGMGISLTASRSEPARSYYYSQE
jgi:membrane associated rhomboid family serine protease